MDELTPSCYTQRPDPLEKEASFQRGWVGRLSVSNGKDSTKSEIRAGTIGTIEFSHIHEDHSLCSFLAPGEDPYMDLNDDDSHHYNYNCCRYQSHGYVCEGVAAGD